MALRTRRGALHLAQGALATDCCCDRSWCVESSTAEPGPCEQTQYECVPSAAAPPNAVAGPFKTEEECECPDLPPCCLTDSDCPPEYCCVDGECVPCSDPPPPPPPEETEYNCCREPSQDPKQLDGTPRCIQGPCLDANGVPAPGLKVGGPYKTPQQCATSCRPYDCATSPCCDKPNCVPADDGPHDTLDKCREVCGMNASPCSISADAAVPITANKVSGAGDGLFRFVVNCDKGIVLGGTVGICVRYVSKKCGAFRIQILADDLDSQGNCTVIAQDVVKVDSKWKGKEQCPCPELDAYPQANPDGNCTGILRWNTKAAGVVEFFVRVFAPCAQDNRNTWAFTIQCTEGSRSPCEDPCKNEPDPCPEGCCEGECDDENPCQEGCKCCGGECINMDAECACEVNEDCPGWSPDGVGCCRCVNGICLDEVSVLYVGPSFGVGFPQLCDDGTGNPTGRCDCGVPNSATVLCFPAAGPIPDTNFDQVRVGDPCPCGKVPVITGWPLDKYPILASDYTVECRDAPWVFIDPNWYPAICEPP